LRRAKVALSYPHAGGFDAKDLIYEGIATYPLAEPITSRSKRRRQRPDLRRDCDAEPITSRSKRNINIDAKDLIYEGIAT